MSTQTKENLKNKIIEHIYTAILKDEYKTTDQIKEIPLSIKLKVSRAPIREALSELVSLGILEQIEKRGVFLKEITSQDIYDTYESKGVIEGYLATSFAKHANQKDFEQMDKFVLQMSAKENNKTAVALIGGKFHKYSIKYATNQVLIETLNRLNKKSQLLFSRNWSKLYSIEEINTRHQKISDALKTRNNEQIEKCIKDHYLETGTKIVLLNDKKDK